ncbi:MAG: DUF2177 family protein [Pseudomonadota bacterium]|nr:DUF2177 family protein [Pseudomonadota bacterium]
MTDPQRLGGSEIGLAYGAALLALLVLDGLWLGFVAKDLYRREMGTLMADSVRIAPAAAFYLLYPAALVYLTLLLPSAGWGEAILRGAVLGLAAYGAYDLTSLAVVRNWPLRLSLIDLAWGAVISAAAAAAGYAATWARH